MAALTSGGRVGCAWMTPFFDRRDACRETRNASALACTSMAWAGEPKNKAEPRTHLPARERERGDRKAGSHLGRPLRHLHYLRTRQRASPGQSPSADRGPRGISLASDEDANRGGVESTTATRCMPSAPATESARSVAGEGSRRTPRAVSNSCAGRVLVAQRGSHRACQTCGGWKIASMRVAPATYVP
jgi:hypothetical protein